MPRIKKKLQLCRFLFFVALLFLMLPFGFVSAKDLSSPSFIIRDPLMGTGGGFYSSGSFQLTGSGDSLLTGFSNSTSFIGKYGFLYFPFIKSGVLSASVVGSTVNMSWTASTAGQGFLISGYKVGKSSVSGGPYVFTSVGNVTSYSYTSQPAGTYYFVLQTLDGFGSVAAVSSEVTAIVSTVIVTPPPPAPPASGGGGGAASNVYIAGRCKIADFNCDGYVNILDFSILLYYADKSGSVIIPYDLSKDGQIDIRDVSIMFYYWDF